MPYAGAGVGVGPGVQRRRGPQDVFSSRVSSALIPFTVRLNHSGPEFRRCPLVAAVRKGQGPLKGSDGFGEGNALSGAGQGAPRGAPLSSDQPGSGEGVEHLADSGRVMRQLR